MENNGHIPDAKSVIKVGKANLLMAMKSYKEKGEKPKRVVIMAQSSCSLTQCECKY